MNMYGHHPQMTQMDPNGRFMARVYHVYHIVYSAYPAFIQGSQKKGHWPSGRRGLAVGLLKKSERRTEHKAVAASYGCHGSVHRGVTKSPKYETIIWDNYDLTYDLTFI